MAIDWAPFVRLVREHRRFLLTTHVRPDGDGLGAMLALSDTLRTLGKETNLVIAIAIPPRYNFMDPQGLVQHFTLPGDAYRTADVAIVLDTGTWNQLGDFGSFLRDLTVPKVVIDHHLTQDDLGAVRLVDVKAEATGRLVFEAIQALGVPLTQTAADALFVALAMDTGWFRHNNTRPETFQLAAELQRAGARPTDSFDLLFEQNSPAKVRLNGVVMGRLQTADNGLISYSYLQKDDYAATGATPQDTEDMINFIRAVAGVEVALFFMEQPRGGVKVSFRSRQKVDVARLAEQFNGGGHRLASGAIVEAPLEEVRARVLAAASTALAAS